MSKNQNIESLLYITLMSLTTTPPSNHQKGPERVKEKKKRITGRVKPFESATTQFRKARLLSLILKEVFRKTSLGQPVIEYSHR